jgi:hypothetical protein
MLSAPPLLPAASTLDCPPIKVECHAVQQPAGSRLKRVARIGSFIPALLISANPMDQDLLARHGYPHLSESTP